MLHQMSYRGTPWFLIFFFILSDNELIMLITQTLSGQVEFSTRSTDLNSKGWQETGVQEISISSLVSQNSNVFLKKTSNKNVKCVTLCVPQGFSWGKRDSVFLVCAWIKDIQFYLQYITTTTSHKHAWLPHRGNCFLWKCWLWHMHSHLQTHTGNSGMSWNAFVLRRYIFSRIYCMCMLWLMCVLWLQPNIMHSSWTKLCSHYGLSLGLLSFDIWGTEQWKQWPSSLRQQKNNTKIESCYAFKVTLKLKVQPIYFTSLSAPAHHAPEISKLLLFFYRCFN